MEHMGSIHRAALQGDLECVMRLVEADPGLVHARVGYEAHTPLHVAAKRQHVDIVAYLLHRGAKLDEADRLGFTALCLVCATGRGVGRRDVVEVLLANGADICVCAHNGMTPVTAAAAGGDSELLKMLLACDDGGDTVDAPGAWGKSALWDACRYGRIKVARVLLEAGADPTRADKDGRNPMDIASVSKRHKGCVKLLQEWERPYLMIKSRRLYDFSLTTTTKPSSPPHTLSDITTHTHPTPAYLARRTVTTTTITTMTSGMLVTTAMNTAIETHDNNRGTAGDGHLYPALEIVERGWRSFGAGGCGGGAGVRTAVVRFVLEVLQGELFVEVMDAVGMTEV